MTLFRSKAHSLLRLIVLACALASSGVYADEYAGITKLLKQKKPTEALASVEKLLEKTPRDPQLRFLQGVAQSDLGNTEEAVQTFTRLTQDYPELPEPYNNLAVLYANQNQLEKAQQALEQAVRTNPDYGIAYENLADIYVKLAAEAYAKAMRYDPTTRATSQPKLNLIRQMLRPAESKGSTSGNTPVKAPANTAAPSAAMPAPAPASSPAAAK